MKNPEITPKLEADAGEIRWICTTGCPKETYGNFVLNRKTLELRSATEKFNCEVLPSSITLKEKLSSRVNELQNQYDEELKEMSATRQRLKEEGTWILTKTMTNRIRRQLKKEKLEDTIKYFEEELWFDVKQAKSSYLLARLTRAQPELSQVEPSQVPRSWLTSLD